MDLAVLGYQEIDSVSIDTEENSIIYSIMFGLRFTD